jgi:hypothetical protein
MAKVKLLNVRKHLEHEVASITDMLERSGKVPHGLQLAPIDSDNLRELRFIAQSILNKHTRKRTRKDIYVEIKP